MSSSSSSSEEEKEKIPFSELVKQWSEKIGKNERMNWSSRKYKIDDDDAKAIAEVLKTNTTLTSMDAFNKKITAVGAKAIAEALKTNKTLTDIRLSRKLSFSLSLSLSLFSIHSLAFVVVFSNRQQNRRRRRKCVCRGS